MIKIISKENDTRESCHKNYTSGLRRNYISHSMVLSIFTQIFVKMILADVQATDGNPWMIMMGKQNKINLNQIKTRKNSITRPRSQVFSVIKWATATYLIIYLKYLYRNQHNK